MRGRAVTRWSCGHEQERESFPGLVADVLEIGALCSRCKPPKTSSTRAWLRRERAAESPHALAGERATREVRRGNPFIVGVDDPEWVAWCAGADLRREARAALRRSLLAGLQAYDDGLPRWGGLGGIEGGRELDLSDRFEADVARVLGEDLRRDEALRGELWSSLANVDWVHERDRDHASYSFRAAGDLVAAVVGSGDYMDYYCNTPDGVVSPRVAEALGAAGWVPDWTWLGEREEAWGWADSAPPRV